MAFPDPVNSKKKKTPEKWSSWAEFKELVLLRSIA